MCGFSGTEFIPFGQCNWEYLKSQIDNLEAKYIGIQTPLVEETSTCYP